MLDPATALSLASSVVQFVDFGIKAVSEAREIYQSADGVSPKNAKLEETIAEVGQFSERITLVPLSNADTPSTSDDEKALSKLAKSSKDLADEILIILRNLQVQTPHRRWKSSRKALAGMWKEDKIRELEKKAPYPSRSNESSSCVYDELRLSS